MKRLVETARWQDNFYMELHPYPKLLLSYLYDNADFAGFIDFNAVLWLTQIEGIVKSKRYCTFTKKDLLNSLEDLKPKLLSDKKKKLFIIDFLKHQNKLPLIKGTEEGDLIISKLQINLSKFNDAPEIQNILNSIIDQKKIDEEEALNEKNNKSGKKKVNFKTPDYETFKAYYLTQKINPDEDDVKGLYDHYVTVGWVYGRNKTPIKDYESAIRGSIRRDEQYKKNNSAGIGNKSNYNSENKKSRTETTLSVVEELTKKKN